MAEVEGDLLPGCGWTPLTANRAYRAAQPGLQDTGRPDSEQAPCDTGHANVNAKHTWSCAVFFLDGFCMAPSLLLLTLIGQLGSDRETVWSWELLS